MVENCDTAFIAIVIDPKLPLLKLPKSEEKRHLKSDIKLNLHVSDKICGFCRDDGITLYVEKRPMLVLSDESIDVEYYLNDALIWTIKSPTVRASKVRSIMNIFQKQKEGRNDNITSIGSYIDRELKILAQNYRSTYSGGPLDSVIQSREIGSLLKWWYKHRIMRYLEHYGIDFKMVQLIDQPPLKIINTINTNPYTIPQIPLNIASEIAAINGIVLSDDDKRCGEIIRYVYIQTTENAWTYLPLSQFEAMYKDFRLLKDTLTKTYDLYFDDDRVYTNQIFDKESDVANYLNSRGGTGIIPKYEKFIESEREKGYLSEDQLEALDTILGHQASIITGPAGSGKTSLLETLVPYLNSQGKSSVFVSFTGKAVSRLRDKLRKHVDIDRICTIHWYISHYDINTRPDFVFVDETSMVGMYLFYRLTCLLKHQNHHICFIGDPYQLDPIEDVNLLGELVKSNIPHSKLTTIHRVNGTDGGIYKNGQAIRNANDSDVSIIDYPDFNMIYKGVNDMRDLIYQFLDGGISSDRITILSPYNKSIDSYNSIFRDRNTNVSIQDAIKRFSGPKEWKVGDRVMMTENCYDIGVMNGEEGKITKYNGDLNEMIIDFGHNRVHPFSLFDKKGFYDEYNSSRDTVSKDNLTMRYVIPSYAQTIHKSQGSEWDIVFLYMPNSDNNTGFLNRRLLYTALTRARKLLFVFGSISTLKNGINTVPSTKYLYLSNRINIHKYVHGNNIAIMELKKYGITNKKDWKKWLLENHPDKNKDSNEETVKIINELANKAFP